MSDINSVLGIGKQIWFFPNECREVKSRKNYFVKYTKNGKNAGLPVDSHYLTTVNGVDVGIMRGAQMLASAKFRHHDANKDVLFEFTPAPVGYLKEVGLEKKGIVA